jgi:cytochrome c biogenesis factor
VNISENPARPLENKDTDFSTFSRKEVLYSGKYNVHLKVITLLLSVLTPILHLLLTLYQLDLALNFENCTSTPDRFLYKLDLICQGPKTIL